jgi:hypothetical protein
MKREILFKKNGQYITYVKEFKDEEHLTNYLNLMLKRGFKEIGIYEA